MRCQVGIDSCLEKKSELLNNENISRNVIQIRRQSRFHFRLEWRRYRFRFINNLLRNVQLNGKWTSPKPEETYCHRRRSFLVSVERLLCRKLNWPDGCPILAECYYDLSTRNSVNFVAPSDAKHELRNRPPDCR